MDFVHHALLLVQLLELRAFSARDFSRCSEIGLALLCLALQLGPFCLSAAARC